MALVEYVRVDGLGNRREPVEMTFQPDVNVLWGTNGSGKTSILKILHSALAGDASPLLRLTFQAAEVRIIDQRQGVVTRRLTRDAMEELSWRRSKRHGSALMREDPAFEQKTLFDEAEVLGWESSPAGAGSESFSHRYLPISRISEFKSRYGRVTRSSVQELIDEAHYDRVFAEQIQSLWSEHQIQSQARVRFAQQDALARVVSAMFGIDEKPVPLDLNLSAAEAENLVSNFLSGQAGMGRRRVPVPRISTEFDSNPQIRRIVATVQSVIAGIEESQAPERRFVRVINEMLGETKALSIENPRVLSVQVARDESEIPIEFLSSGEKQMFRLLLESLIATKNSVLVDEPEISLHVDWQAVLMENMSIVNPDAQIIAASHSPEIIAGVAARSIFEV